MLNASSDIPTPPLERPRAKRYAWSPVSGMAMILFGFLLLPVVAGVVTSFIPTLLGWDSIRADEWIMDSPVANFLYVLLAEALTLGAIWWFVSYKKVSFKKAVGLGPLKVRDFGYAILGFVVYFVLFIITLLSVQQFFTIDESVEQSLGFDKGIDGLGLALAFASLVILPPVAEEIIFRGFFYGTLRGNGARVGVAVIVTSIVFGSLHLFGSADGRLVWLAAIDTFVLSVILCYLREKTGTIWSCIFLHALKNGIVFLNLFVINAA